MQDSGGACAVLPNEVRGVRRSDPSLVAHCQALDDSERRGQPELRDSSEGGFGVARRATQNSAGATGGRCPSRMRTTERALR